MEFVVVLIVFIALVGLVVLPALLAVLLSYCLAVVLDKILE